MAHLAVESRKLVNPARVSYAKNAGFTLIEIVVVIAIIGIIAALAIPNYRRINENMKFEDAYQQTRNSFNKCRGEAVSMESAHDMSSGVTTPVSIALFPNGFACIVWYDKNGDGALGSAAINPGSDGELDAGEASGEVQTVLFQTRYDQTVAINAVPAGPRIDTATSTFGGDPDQNASRGYLFRILPGGYFQASDGSTATAHITMLPKDGPPTKFILYPSGQVVGM